MQWEEGMLVEVWMKDQSMPDNRRERRLFIEKI
jgi:hypothetical protein